jgi:hypothetical protein
MKGHINTSVGKSLLVGYGTNAAYPNTTSTSNFIMLSHSTFNGNIGFNYPNPECGILMTNGSQNGHPWCFYSGVVKYVAATNPIASLRYDIGNCLINNTLYTMTGTTTFNPSISLLYTGKVGIGTATPETSLHVSGTTLLNNNTTMLSSLNVSGKTTFGLSTMTGTALAASVFEVYNNIGVQKNRNDGINTGDYSYISAGTGNSGCFIYLDEGAIPLGDAKMSLIGINAFNTQVNGSLNVSGKVTFGQESPPISNSVFSVSNNISVIKKQATPENNNIGDVIHLNAGTTLSSYITISDNSNISINSNGSTRIYGKQLEFFWD